MLEKSIHDRGSPPGRDFLAYAYRRSGEDPRGDA